MPEEYIKDDDAQQPTGVGADLFIRKKKPGPIIGVGYVVEVYENGVKVDELDAKDKKKVKEIINMYKIACEGLEYQYDPGNYMNFAQNLHRIGLLQPSCFTQSPLEGRIQKCNQQFYYLTISPEMLKDILDIAFGLLSFE